MDDKKIAKYIERIEIKGLWGQFDVNWKLHEDVNILVGENGTGKSTVLRLLLAQLIEHQTQLKLETTIFNEFFRYEKMYEDITVWYDDEKKLNIKTGISDKSELKYIDKAISEFPDKYINAFYVNTNEIEWAELGRLHYKEGGQTRGSDTTLDMILKPLIGEYVNYQLNLAKRLIKNNNNGKGQTQDEIYDKMNTFTATVNDLFKVSEKLLNEEDNKISFINSNEKIIELEQLSSGEKQLLIILLTVLIQNEKPAVLLMDEPEVSLDTSWQSPLIKIIRELNPNCQVIVVTHSTSIFMDGHQEKLFWMDDKENGILEKTKHRQTTI